MSLDQMNPFVSRRNFVRLLGAGLTATTTLRGFGQQSTIATDSRPRGVSGSGADMGEVRKISPDTVVISSNENPLGPSEAALNEMAVAGPLGGRYDKTGVARKTIETISEQFGLRQGYVQLFPGSGGPLDMALMSSISPTRGLVCADPAHSCQKSFPKVNSLKIKRAEPSHARGV